ncbi:MAG: DcaP family trimeric outer membrane transporter [Bacteroidales bacterium]|nr:DcaP family trimeric outer membrane transporter [Bacteroidales bacterium]
MFLFAALSCCPNVSAQDTRQSLQKFNFYGFISNYFVYDTHKSSAGLEDLFYYMPSDTPENESTFNFVSLTSRVGVDVSGYQIKGRKIGAKVEADFYLKSGTTAALRLRQAYLTIARRKHSWKIGQAWHPMAIDLPDIFSFECGVPFGPYSHTPQVLFEFEMFDNNYLDIAALWQMQYTSTGPNGASAEYIRKAKTPEAYLGYNYRKGDTSFKLGADMLSIMPETAGRLTNFNFFEYFQKTFGVFTLKEKVTYAMDGSHMNMVGGYGKTPETETYVYSATRSVSGWMTFAFCKDKPWSPSLFVGYIRNLGTKSPVNSDCCWFMNNASNLNQMYRVQPELVYNLGKVQIGLEYMFTSVQYGKSRGYMVAVDDLHWVSNHRAQAIVKYTF